MNNRDRESPDPQPGEDGRVEPTEEEVWQDLVARLEHDDSGAEPGPGNDAGPPPAAGPAPAAGANDPEPGRSSSTETPPAGPSAGAEAARADQEHLGGPRDYATSPEDDGYTPEDPPTLAGAQPLTVLAWIGAVGAPIAMLLSALLWRAAPFSAILGMIVVFIAAVAFLLARLPRERDNDDDGAVV